MTQSSSRTPTLVDGDKVSRNLVHVPLRKNVFHADKLKTPDDVARQLNTMQQDLHDATLPARSNPHNQSVTFVNQQCQLATQFTINHNLGHIVRWSVVRWRSATFSQQTLVEVSQDNQTITFFSNTVGIADIEVW